jgi:hypothetical protein
VFGQGHDWLNCSIHIRLVTNSVVIKTTSRVVYHELEPRTGQTKDYEIGTFCFSAEDKEQTLVGSESE